MVSPERNASQNLRKKEYKTEKIEGEKIKILGQLKKGNNDTRSSLFKLQTITMQ